MSNTIIQQLAQGAEKRSILIVEDDIELSISLIRILKVFFHTYVLAGDGEEALQIYTEHLNTTPFDLIITDLELPKLGGLSLIRKIRELRYDQPIIILSAHDESEYMSEAIRLGVQSYLLKPLVMTSLFDSLEQILNVRTPHYPLQRKKEKITGWKSFDSLEDRISETSSNLTFVRFRFNQLNNIIMLLGELYAHEYLSQATELLESLLTDTDGEFYHITTNEFCLIFSEYNIDYITNLANTMVSVIRYFYTSDRGIILNSTLSIGIAHGVHDLLLHSKIALEKVDDLISGGVGHYLYDEMQNNQCDDVTIDQSRTILKMIFDALNNESIIPFFQPIHNAQDNEVCMYESLIRIEHEGVIHGPEVFLQLSKEMGQMAMITRSMIRNTFHLSQKFAKEEKIILNLTSYDLNDEGILPYINFWLERYCIAPNKIIFQISEGIEALKNKTVIASLKELQSNGHEVILNNFGSGQCNLSLLLLLQPNYIKLHNEIVQKIDTEPFYFGIIEKMIDIIHQIGSKAIASHISNPTQNDLFKNTSVDFLQGNLFREAFDARNKPNYSSKGETC